MTRIFFSLLLSAFFSNGVAGQVVTLPAKNSSDTAVSVYTADSVKNTRNTRVNTISPASSNMGMPTGADQDISPSRGYYGNYAAANTIHPTKGDYGTAGSAPIRPTQGDYGNTRDAPISPTRGNYGAAGSTPISPTRGNYGNSGASPINPTNGSVQMSKPVDNAFTPVQMSKPVQMSAPVDNAFTPVQMSTPVKLTEEVELSIPVFMSDSVTMSTIIDSPTTVFYRIDESTPALTREDLLKYSGFITVNNAYIIRDVMDNAMNIAFNDLTVKVLKGAITSLRCGQFGPICFVAKFIIRGYSVYKRVVPVTR